MYHRPVHKLACTPSSKMHMLIWSDGTIYVRSTSTMNSKVSYHNTEAMKSSEKGRTIDFKPDSLSEVPCGWEITNQTCNYRMCKIKRKARNKNHGGTRGKVKTLSEGKFSGSGGHRSAWVDRQSSQMATSEDGRMEQVLATSWVEYDDKENMEGREDARLPAGEAVKSEIMYTHGVLGAMLVTSVDGDNAAKVDRFGSQEFNTVDKEGYGNQKVQKKEETIAPIKDQQCQFCFGLLEAVACRECASNSLNFCKLFQEKNVPPNVFIPDPLLRKKVLGISNKALSPSREDKVKTTKLPPVTQLLTGNSVLSVNIMMQKQREAKRLVKDEFSNISSLDSDTSHNSFPMSDARRVGALVADSAREGGSSSGQEKEVLLSEDQVSQSRRPSPPQAKCSSPFFQTPLHPDTVYVFPEGVSSPSPLRSSSKLPIETSRRATALNISSGRDDRDTKVPVGEEHELYTNELVTGVFGKVANVFLTGAQVLASYLPAFITSFKYEVPSLVETSIASLDNMEGNIDLLRAGDIEENPGPLRCDMINFIKFLCFLFQWL